MKKQLLEDVINNYLKKLEERRDSRLQNELERCNS